MAPLGVSILCWYSALSLCSKSPPFRPGSRLTYRRFIPHHAALLPSDVCSTAFPEPQQITLKGRGATTSTWPAGRFSRSSLHSDNRRLSAFFFAFGRLFGLISFLESSGRSFVLSIQHGCSDNYISGESVILCDCCIPHMGFIG